jgi:hypothetical protein
MNKGKEEKQVSMKKMRPCLLRFLGFYVNFLSSLYILDFIPFSDEYLANISLPFSRMFLNFADYFLCCVETS